MPSVKVLRTTTYGCCGLHHNDPAALRRVSLYEAAIRHAPQIIPYPALPPGVLVAMGGDDPIIFRGGMRLELRPGSYLALRYAGR